MSRRFDFFLERANFGRYINLNLAMALPPFVQYGDPGAPMKRSVARSIAFEEIDPDLVAEVEGPFLRLTMDDAQHLMDELWRCGVRPVDGTGSTGQLGATERHLADMRKISFDLLAKVQP